MCSHEVVKTVNLVHTRHSARSLKGETVLVPSSGQQLYKLIIVNSIA